MRVRRIPVGEHSTRVPLDVYGMNNTEIYDDDRANWLEFVRDRLEHLQHVLELAQHRLRGLIQAQRHVLEPSPGELLALTADAAQVVAGVAVDVFLQ